MVLFRCHNNECTRYEQPQSQPITRTALRKMSQPDSTDKFMCVTCGGLFPLSAREKENNLRMLDEEAAAEAKAS